MKTFVWLLHCYYSNNYNITASLLTRLSAINESEGHRRRGSMSGSRLGLDELALDPREELCHRIGLEAMPREISLIFSHAKEHLFSSLISR